MTGTVAAVTGTPLVIAHRGAHDADVAENTFAAFERAAELGADMIELDVRRVATGELVIFHDATCGGVPVGELSRAELARRSGVDSPLLDDVLAWALGRMALDVELKEDGYVEEVSQRLSAHAAGGGELIVTSFLDRVLGQLPPSLRRGLLVLGTAAGALGRAEACGAEALVVQMGLLDDKLLRLISSAGLACMTWDFFPNHEVQVLHDERIVGVITDDVAGALAVR
jgi:glycerophosphoryl diester phosphodiesterase